MTNMITIPRSELKEAYVALQYWKDVCPQWWEERDEKIKEILRARISAPEPEPTEIETLKQCLFQMQEASKEQTKAFDRLVRIMGTFDLATGHADGWNDLLDSLESELRDILGHYREALKTQSEPWTPDDMAYRPGGLTQPEPPCKIGSQCVGGKCERCAV